MTLWGLVTRMKRRRDDAASRPREEATPRPKAPTRAELQARVRRGEHVTDVERQIAAHGYYWPRAY